METIKQAGFHIAARKETTMSREVVEQMYKDAKDREYYEDLVEYMTRCVTVPVFCKCISLLTLSHCVVCLPMQWSDSVHGAEWSRCC